MIEKRPRIGQQAFTNSGKKSRSRTVLGSIQRRIWELTEEKEAARREVVELRKVVAEQTGQLEALARSVELLSSREDDLRAMLLGAHEQLMRRADGIQATLAAELQHRLLQRNAAKQGAPNAQAPVRAADQSFVSSEHSGYQQLSKHVRYQRLILRIREVARAALPREATVIVVSKGDEELLDLDGRRAWHFPRQEDGKYAGHHPADSAEAVAHLEELRAKGGGFLLLPATAFWWLEYYGEFSRHLESRYRRIRDDEACVIYELTETQPEAEAR